MNKHLLIFSIVIFFSPHINPKPACPAKKRTLTDVDYNLIRAVTANDVGDTTEALRATNVYVNAQEAYAGNTPFAIAAYNFVTAKQKRKKSEQVAAGKIIQKLLENGAKPITTYHSPSGPVFDMKDDVELIFLIQKYSARRE